MKIHNLQEEDLRNTISRLAFFSPTTTDDYGHQLLDYLILDCSIDFGTTIISLKDIKFSISKNLLVEFAEDEILSSARRLASKKFLKIIEATKRFDKPKIQILEKAEEQVASNRKSLSTLEEDVFKEWRIELKEKYKGNKILSDNELKIVDILQHFTSKMFVKHGVETVSLLYPGDSKVKKWLNEGANDILDSLIPKTDAFFENVVKIEIPKFFQSNNLNRSNYISNLFNSSFFWHLIQVDEKCSKLLQKVTRGQKLFLDNNILYSLVGLHGKDALESSSSMLKFANELGYSLVVTTKTLDEFQNTLKWHLKETRQNLPVSATLAKIALDELGSDNFLTSYWAKMVSQGVSIEEFVANISYIEDILLGLKIDTFNKFRKDIEKSEELKGEMSTLRKACGDHINIHIVEHDAFHRILITKLRKGLKYNFNDAKAWFLTHDHKLPHYSKYARNGQAHLPFCITTNEWIQINRPLLTRAKTQEDFEESFHILVTQSYVRSMLPTVPLEKAYNKVLGKLDRFKGMTPEIASRVASDAHFMISILNIDDDAELEEKIESRLIDLNKELRQKNEELTLKNKSEAIKIEKLEGKLETVIKEIQETKAQSSNLATQQSKREADLEDKITELEENLDTEKTEKEKLHKKLTDKEIADSIRNWKKPAYWSLLGIAAVLVLIFLSVCYQTKSWNFVVTFFDWAESQSELRKEIIKWAIVLLLGGTQYWSVKLVWKRLLNQKNEKLFIEGLEEQKKPVPNNV